MFLGKDFKPEVPLTGGGMFLLVWVPISLHFAVNAYLVWGGGNEMFFQELGFNTFFLEGVCCSSM